MKITSGFACLLTAIGGLAAAPSPSWAWTCESQTSAQDFRDYLADRYFTFDAKTRSDMIADCRKVVEQTKIALELTKFDACLGRAKHYADILNRSGDRGLGLEITNVEFKQKYGDILAIPQELANKDLFDLLQKTNLAKPETVKLTVDKIKSLLHNNAIVLPYVSPNTQSIDDAPDTRGRIVVWYDDKDKEVSKYIQFTVDADPKPPAPSPGTTRRQASVVNIKRTGLDKGTYIFDWQRGAPTDPTDQKFKYNAGFGNNDHCYGCHANGVLAIHPFQGEPDEFGDAAKLLGLNGKPADWLNNLNDQYAQDAVKMNDQIDKDWAQEASIVAEAPTRKLVSNDDSQVPDGLQNPSASKACSVDEQKAAAALRPRGPLAWDQWLTDWNNYVTSGGGMLSAYKRVQGKEHTCGTCHDDRSKALYEPGRYTAMMTKYIESGFMPPNLPSYYYDKSKRRVLKNEVPVETRRDALACFLKATNNKVKDWIKGTKCS
jgi:hypothetical protein